MVTSSTVVVAVMEVVGVVLLVKESCLVQQPAAGLFLGLVLRFIGVMWLTMHFTHSKPSL